MRAVILPAAELTFARLFGLGEIEARALIRDLVRAAHPTPKPAPDGHEIWRAGRAWEKVCLLVERVSADEVRVVDVLPPHHAWRAPPAPGPDGRSRRRPGVVRSADPPPASPAPAPAVDRTLLLLAGVEIAGGTYPSASVLAERLRVPRETARRALAALELPEHNPREQHAAGVEVLRARRRG